MLPPAPARLSMITGCLMFSESFAAQMRAMVSLAPPGACVTTIVICLLGYLSCETTVPAARSPPKIAAPSAQRMDCTGIVSSSRWVGAERVGAILRAAKTREGLGLCDAARTGPTLAAADARLY